MTERLARLVAKYGEDTIAECIAVLGKVTWVEQEAFVEEWRERRTHAS